MYLRRVIVAIYKVPLTERNIMAGEKCDDWPLESARLHQLSQALVGETPPPAFDLDRERIETKCPTYRLDLRLPHELYLRAAHVTLTPHWLAHRSA